MTAVGASGVAPPPGTSPQPDHWPTAVVAASVPDWAVAGDTLALTSANVTRTANNPTTARTDVGLN